MPRLRALGPLLIAATALGQSHALPNGASAAAANSSNNFPWASASAWAGVRLLAVYDSGNFVNAGIDHPIVIRRLRWRANDVGTTAAWVGGTYASATIRLSTAGVDYTGVTTTFANNHGADLTLAYAGAVDFQPGVGGGTGVPGPVVVDVHLTTPFLYDPARGDLAVDVDYGGGANFTANGPGTAIVAVDVHTTGSAASRVYASLSYPNADGVTIDHGPVLIVDYDVVDEIPAPTVRTSAIDMDAAGPSGAITLSSLNAAGSPTPATLAGIQLAPSGAPGPGVYDTNTAGGRALVLATPATSGMALIDPPAGQFTPFDARLTFVHPCKEIGLAIGDHLGALRLDFFRNAQLVTSYRTNPMAGAAMRYFRLLDGNFDRLDVTADAPNASWVITALEVENALATATAYGPRCYDRLGTFNELFSPTGFDLSLTTMSMTFDAQQQRYTVQTGTAPYAPPSATAVALALGDDDEVTVTLASSLPYPGGSTNQLVVCSNGFVSVPPGNGTAYAPSLQAFRDFQHTCWSCWHDYDPSALNSGSIWFDEVGSHSIVTWGFVRSFGSPNSATFQFRFDRSTGDVDVAWHIVQVGGNEHLVGYTCGASTVPCPSIDLGAALATPFPAFCDVEGLSLSTSSPPRLGTTVGLVTANIPAGALLSASLVALLPTPPISLAAYGMPGCYSNVDLASAASTLLFGGPTATQSLVIPANLAFVGVELFAQAASLVPGSNPLGAITSNGLRVRIDRY